MGSDVQLLSAVAESCAGLGAQVILSLGGRGQPEHYKHLSKDVLVVSYAPQRELLERAELLVTHAGINTVMEALACGVPMVAIPIAVDQPGTAARVAYTGVGEVLPVADCRRELLRPMVERIRAQSSYRANAVKLKQALTQYRGSEAAADIVEGVLATRRPVNRKSAGTK
jgi:MGT family glycosyltransferase